MIFYEIYYFVMGLGALYRQEAHLLMHKAASQPIQSLIFHGASSLNPKKMF